MVQILEYTEGKVIAAKASKKLVASDYYKLLPLFVNRLKRYPNIRLYLDIRDLEGLELDELKEDMDFNTGLASAFDKVALLGEKTEEQWMADLLKPFTSAEVKWFDSEGKDAAIAWLRTNRSNVKGLAGSKTPLVVDYALSGS
jgi:hypothetical protein